MDTTTSRYSHQRYDELLEEIFADMKRLAKLKGDEYAHGDDRLDNFRRNAADVGVTMETCWRIYAGKHWDAITQYVKDQQSGTGRERMEGIRSRALDLMVYLTLFIAMVEEQEGVTYKSPPFTGKVMSPAQED